MKKLLSIVIVLMIVSLFSISVFASGDLPDTPEISDGETGGGEEIETPESASDYNAKLDIIIELLTPQEEVENEYEATVEYEASDTIGLLLEVVRQFFLTDFGKILISIMGLCFAIIVIKILLKG